MIFKILNLVKLRIFMSVFNVGNTARCRQPDEFKWDTNNMFIETSVF
jgi:hypothetical protein